MAPNKDYTKTPPYVEKYRQKQLAKTRAQPPAILPDLKSFKALEKFTPSQITILGSSVIFIILFLVVLNLQVFFKGKPLDYYASTPVLGSVARLFVLNDKLYILFAIAYGAQSIVCDLVLPKVLPNMSTLPRVVIRTLAVVLLYNLSTGFLVR